MSNALLTDVEARAERRRTRTRDDMWRDLAEQAWRRGTAESDPAAACRWLDRAHRLAPEDGVVALSLATALLRAGRLTEAAAAFEAEVRRRPTVEARCGLVTCAHLLHDTARAQAALGDALRAFAPTGALGDVARAVAGSAGWCGLTAAGVLHAGPARPTLVRLDGEPARLAWSAGTARLPGDWRRLRSIEVESDAGPMLGSPLSPAVITAVEGFVEADGGGVRGWAWHPADAAQDPVLHIAGVSGTRTLRATQPDNGVVGIRPLGRPRRIVLTAAEVGALGPPIAVRGPDGRHLLGSPLYPGLESRAAADPAHVGFAPVWADVIGPPHATWPPRKPAVDVIIPVHGGRETTLACLDSLLASLPRGSRAIVVDDAGPDRALAAALDRLACRRRIVLLRLAENRGFPGAANAGIDAAAGHDVVLLNSDTLVPPGWLERLRAAAYSAPDIGSATPLTNDGTIVSYPAVAGGNPIPDLAATVALDALAQRANADAVVDLPVGVGFCLYLRRDCLDAVGLLREDLFAQGYGEENDWCLRARHRGWRNVAAAGVFVTHHGAASFGAARAHLVRRNGAILERLHPGYAALVAAHETTDPLHPARRRMDELRWKQGRSRGGAVLMVTHGGGGGVDRVIADRAARVAALGQRPIVLRPARTAAGMTAARVEQPGADRVPNLVFAMPGELPALIRLLRADLLHRVELHHTLGHHAAVASLTARLGVPLESVVHDYARFCPRIALVGPTRRYCGEPDVAGCEACIADTGSLLEDDPPVPLLIERSGAELAAAVRVVAPSDDAAARMRRHFPHVQPVVEPWEDDRLWPPLASPAQGPVRRVLVAGAVGVEKGFEVLLGCARDARARGLPLEFVVVGFTADDERLMAAGPVLVTGEYAEAEAVALIRAQRAQLAFIPSIWPETWCFALSRVWEADLAAAVFDLGAQAERVRRTGRGWTLPLGLSPAGVNDALLRLAPDRLPTQCPPHSMPT